MVVFTTDKIVIIVVVTVIVIVLAYVFRFGRFSRRKQKGPNSDGFDRSLQTPTRAAFCKCSGPRRRETKEESFFNEASPRAFVYRVFLWKP